eukprot:scaffold205256_cov45-Attheya_sp.AAC.1
MAIAIHPHSDPSNHLTHLCLVYLLVHALKKLFTLECVIRVFELVIESFEPSSVAMLPDRENCGPQPFWFPGWVVLVIFGCVLCIFVLEPVPFNGESSVT